MVLSGFVLKEIIYFVRLFRVLVHVRMNEYVVWVKPCIKFLYIKYSYIVLYSYDRIIHVLN